VHWCEINAVLYFAAWGQPIPFYNYVAGPCFLQDEDPYVRKTAAVCVAKLYDINPDLVVEQGFIETLRDLLSDANPMVCWTCSS
jgi:hypothetical protein